MRRRRLDGELDAAGQAGGPAHHQRELLVVDVANPAQRQRAEVAADSLEHLLALGRRAAREEARREALASHRLEPLGAAAGEGVEEGLGDGARFGAILALAHLARGGRRGEGSDQKAEAGDRASPRGARAGMSVEWRNIGTLLCSSVERSEELSRTYDDGATSLTGRPAGPGARVLFGHSNKSGRLRV